MKTIVLFIFFIWISLSLISQNQQIKIVEVKDESYMVKTDSVSKNVNVKNVRKHPPVEIESHTMKNTLPDETKLPPQRNKPNEDFANPYMRVRKPPVKDVDLD